MTRILICDDEGIVQESLRFMIDKSFGSECEVESAKNGRAAIELAETFRPDIILMDIQMPGINGIDAMEEIRKENKNMIFIVLTAYDKFEYTQKSIDIGVMAYLTKPISRDSLTDTLRRAMKRVKSRRKEIRENLQVKEKLETVSPMIENGYVYSVLLDGGTETGDVYRNLLNIESGYGYVAVIECGDEIHKGVLSNTIGAGMKLQKHYGIFCEIVKETTGGLLGALMVNKVVVIIPVTSGNEEYEERLQKIDMLRAMLRKLERQIGLAFKAGVGQVESWDKIRDSYCAAVETLRQGSGKVTHVMDMPVGCVYEESYPVELEKDLFLAVERGDEAGTKRFAHDFFSWMETGNPELTNNVRLKVMEFILWAEHLAYMHGNIEYRFSARERYLDLLLSFSNYEELRGWFIQKLEEAARHIETNQREHSQDVVTKAKQYIKKHYATEVSLEKTAREIGISPYYLSRLFKETEGVSYIDYVTKLRMEYAKKELSEGENSIKEICAKSGYGDPNYFSRIFKKWTGFTPTEYREKAVSRGEQKNESR